MLLTLVLVLCTGLLYLPDLFSRENIDKAVLSILVWFVYNVWPQRWRLSSVCACTVMPGWQLPGIF
ncbi:hypothetical protein ACZ87_01480 [Candidatus Erwinia dacicola]|uniref:Uncharacterized protein n=1 Tax=Candidatus Erwinia dacicola TaxID=252393 RepID=A0A328TQM7_9GAMM|nr:hypothetical protein ACZ87_01483 [Candidatus Erwinia dacicola]RAP71703.1 hypothetical protein ACZ87_01480 [Candidatus Erwinia dacicola]